MQNVTLAFVIDRIAEEYGRMTAKVKARLPGELSAWTDRACKKWNFWFLNCEPGLSTLKLFPLDSTQPTANQISYKYGYWIDRGWLATAAGVVAYPFAYPFISSLDLSQDPPMPSSSMGGWTPCEVARLIYVKGFNVQGRPRKDLDILPHQDFAVKARYDAPAEPDYCTFVTEDGISSLVFNTIPDDTYLYQVGFRFGSLPPLDRPDSTNLFLMNCPEVLVIVGCIKVAKYFGEKEEAMYYMSELYGQTYAQERNPDLTPGGMLGDILAESRQRHVPRSRTLKVYTSSRNAQYKMGSMRKFIPGGYYWDGMP